MKEEPKIAYIDGIQTPSNQVPRHPSILNLKGRFYFQKRIPRDLVKSECYGKAEIIKRALKTGDLATARHRAVTLRANRGKSGALAFAIISGLS